MKRELLGSGGSIKRQHSQKISKQNKTCFGISGSIRNLPYFSTAAGKEGEKKKQTLEVCHPENTQKDAPT